MSLKTLQALLEDPQSSQLWVTLPLLEQARYMCSAAAKSLQSCPTLCNPRDSSPLGSPIPGILQARTLEWVAISFSNAWKWKVKVKSLSWVRLLMTPWTAAYQAPPSMGFSRQEYCNGLPLPSPKCVLEPRKEVWEDTTLILDHISFPPAKKMGSHKHPSFQNHDTMLTLTHWQKQSNLFPIPRPPLVPDPDSLFLRKGTKPTACPRFEGNSLRKINLHFHCSPSPGMMK